MLVFIAPQRRAKDFSARLYDVMNVLMTKTCLRVPFAGVTDFTKPGAHPRGAGAVGLQRPKFTRAKIKKKIYIYFVDTMI